MTSDEAEILTIVCPHVRWVGCLRVVISKTLRRPVGGLYAADLPAWFPQAPGVRAANTALKKKKQNRKFRLPLTANPCGAAQNRAASVCRQPLGGMRHYKRKGGCPRTGGAALSPPFSGKWNDCEGGTDCPLSFYDRFHAASTYRALRRRHRYRKNIRLSDCGRPVPELLPIARSTIHHHLNLSLIHI